ncbi:MAG: leucine-rich repeat domain-containing protein [Clostridiales bacterium]|nr:leucine-rich repeat domain-containing protein [Clostridiales bacterium]
MKKWFTIIAVLVVAVCGTVVAACGDDSSGGKEKVPAHTHTADSYIVTGDATCTEDGELTGVCNVCGETFTVVVPATGHDWQLKSKKAATCTDDGVEVYECGNCHELDERGIDALGHDTVGLIPAVAATCEKNGYTEGRECSRCGKVVVAPEEIPATGHKLHYEKRSNDTHAVSCENCDYANVEDCTFDEVVIAPDCTKSGKLIHTCNACGDTHEHETEAALGHLFTESPSFYGAVDGVYKHRKTCYRCAEYVEEDCSLKSGETVLPKCETIGYTVYTCDDCGNTFNSDFEEALGHKWTEYELENDSVDPYAHTHSRHCDREDCDVKESGVEVGTVGAVIAVRTDETCEADAFTDYTCSLPTCEYHKIETHGGTALGHSFGEWEYSGDNDEHHTHTHYCLRTGCEKSETKDCRMTTSSQAATCTKPEIDIDVCEDCFHVDRDESPALGHKWGDWVSLSGGLQHTHVCSVCKTREYGNHTLETTTTPADCENDEMTVNTCSVCGYVKKTATPDTALGHEWTCTESDASTHSLVCSRNNEHTVTESHDYNKSNICQYDGTDGLTYKLSENGDYYIVLNDNGLGTASEIVVPAFRPLPDGGSEVPVLAIGQLAFSVNKNIVTVRLPATITLIDRGAFAMCSELTTVSFYGGESQLTRIEMIAFQACSRLSSIELGDNLVYIGPSAFQGCSGLVDIDVPHSVKEIGLSAFANTGFFADADNWKGGALYAGLHLISVDNSFFTDENDEFTVNDKTITISAYAFQNCTGLRKITIPVSVTTVGSDAFRGCVNLVEVVYGGGVSDWFAITFVSTLSSPMYYATHMTITGEVSEELTLPDNITAIPAGTFKGNTSLRKITIPAKLASIGDEAFMGCINLTQIVFENDNVSYVGKDAFKGTGFYNDGENWTDGVLILGNHIIATNADFSATEYVIADNIRTVSAGAFAAHNIENITIGAGVVWIGADAFNVQALKGVSFVSSASKWMAKNRGGALRSVGVTADAAANANLFRDYPCEWKKA